MRNTGPALGNEQYFEESLPSSEDAERAVLGLVLLTEEEIGDVAARLETTDFYSPANRHVFGAMLELYDAKKPIDSIMIGEELKKTNSLHLVGGISTITNLTWGIPPHTDIDQFIDIIREKAQLRRLINACDRIARKALDNSESAEKIFMEAQAAINEICDEAGTYDREERFIPLRNVIHHEILPALKDLKDGVTNKIKTGFTRLDEMIGGGISTSDVVLIAGLPGSGKSALALQTVFQIASEKVPCAFLAGEMTNRENVLRLISQVSGMVNLNSITKISTEEHEKLAGWAVSIGSVPIYFDHRTCDLQTLAPLLRSIVRKHKIKVLVIDYIQLLKLERVDRRTRNERIAEASQEVKRLANELDIAVIEVAQFNREGAKSMKPGMFDLEGSGQLEKDASMIFILDRDDADGSKVTIRIVKGRNAGNGKLSGKFSGPSLRFSFD